MKTPQRAQRLFKKKRYYSYAFVNFVPFVASYLLLCEIRAIRGQIPAKRGKTWQNWAGFGRKWQNGTVWYRWNHVRNFQYSPGKGVMENER